MTVDLIGWNGNKGQWGLGARDKRNSKKPKGEEALASDFRPQVKNLA